MRVEKVEAERALLSELRSYVGLSAEDADLLGAFHAVAEPHFPAVADEFYAVIRMHEGAHAVLKDEAQAARLHASLQRWLGELLRGPHDDAWAARQTHIAEVHVRVGLELRYMVAAMSRIRVSLQRLAASTTQGGATALRLALARVCDFSLALMVESYKTHLLGRLERARARPQEAGTADEREQVLRDALGAAGVILLALDAQGRLVLANDKAFELTGYAEDEILDADVFPLLFGTEAAAMRSALLDGAARGAVDVEANVRTRAGKVRLVRWRTSGRRGGSDLGPSSVVLVGVDVTHERELERRVRQNERLAAAGALAAGLAHEIRNPLNGANLHVSVLDRALARVPSVPPAAREATEVLRSEIRRLGALVTDFLEVARPKPLTRVDCDVNDIARAVGALLAPEAEQHGARLTIEPFALPASASVDAERIKQVLVNLVRNGFEAAGEGGRVVLRVRRLAHHVEIDVEDDGPGMPDPDAPIFDAFYTTKERGTGLGLSIVQRIVADHGGDVSFESHPGSTIFTVILPAQSVL
jgi:PAS domain S-box-containing protein